MPQQEDRKNRPYELLGCISPGTPPQGLSGEEMTDSNSNQGPTQELTTALITTLYYSALANLYLQTVLPTTLEELDAENPRLKIALDRSYADFTTAQDWLNRRGGDLIATSTARHFYDEVRDMDKDSIMSTTSFYLQS